MVNGAAPALRPGDVEARIGTAWRELRRGASMQALRPIMRGTGPDVLDLGQIDTLDLLVSQGAMRMGDLADALRIDASSATRAVARLVETGLASRRAAPGDARVVVVEPTAAGLRCHRQLMERRVALLTAVLRDFDAGERARLAELLERLVAGVDRFVAEQGAGGRRG